MSSIVCYVTNAQATHSHLRPAPCSLAPMLTLLHSGNSLRNHCPWNLLAAGNDEGQRVIPLQKSNQGQTDELLIRERVNIGNGAQQRPESFLWESPLLSCTVWLVSHQSCLEDGLPNPALSNQRTAFGGRCGHSPVPNMKPGSPAPIQYRKQMVPNGH